MLIIRYLAAIACLGAGALMAAAPGARAQACPNGICPCPTGMIFIDGICQCPTGMIFIDGTCQCPEGSLLVDGACVPG